MTNCTSQPETAPSSQIIDFPVWRTIKIGTHKNMGSLLKGLSPETVIEHLAGLALLMPEFPLAAEEREIDLVYVSAEQLGFPYQKSGQKGYRGCDLPVWITEKEFYARAIEMGLDICPEETAVQLRRQLPDLGKDEPFGERVGDHADELLIVCSKLLPLPKTSGCGPYYLGLQKGGLYKGHEQIPASTPVLTSAYGKLGFKTGAKRLVFVKPRKKV